MLVGVNSDERIVIKKDNHIEIAYLDDAGIPHITLNFFKLNSKEVQAFWELVNKFRGDMNDNLWRKTGAEVVQRINSWTAF